MRGLASIGSILGWDQLNSVAKLDGAGNVTELFVYGSKANVPDSMVKFNADGTTTTYRILSDQLGSVRFVVSTSDGTVAQEIDYDAFGRVMLDTNPGFQPFGFGGGLYDPQTGLVHFGARDYDPEVGRWTSKDPALFGGNSENLYDYTMVDPVNRRDPKGLWQVTIAGGSGPGILITFGNNGGQWNFGEYFGVGGGLSGGINLEDRGCTAPGFHGGIKGKGQIGLGTNLDAQAEVGFEGSSADLGVHIPGTTANVGWSESNGHSRPIGVTIAVGGSAFVGVGGTVYFGN